MAKKKGKGKGAAGKLKKVKWDVNADIHQTRFVKVYQVQCQIDQSVPCPWLMSAMKAGIENRLYVKKFIIEPEEEAPEGLPPNPPIRLDPIIAAMRKSHFVYINELCVWDMELCHRTVASIALMVEKGVFPLTKIELMDCDISYYSVERLSQSFKMINLTEINLDYNEFGDEGCIRLCNCIKNNKTLLQLSLCYCKITKASGVYLGEVAYSSMVREFYLDGNLLECQGMVDFLRSIAVAAEDDHASRIEEARLKALMAAEGALSVTDRMLDSQMVTGTEGSGVETDGSGGKPKKKKKGKKGKKKGKKVVEVPIPGPFVTKLHVADNGFDVYNDGKQEALLPCVQVLSRLIVHSTCLAELDMEYNAIGNLCSGELLAALVRRQEGNLPALKMTVSGEIGDDIYNAIHKLASGVTKKGKKGKKGKKKKKK